MFTKKHLLLLVTLLTVSNSTSPMFNSVTSWLSQVGNRAAENKGTVALVGAGACALGAVAYYVWKKLTRQPKKVVIVKQPVVARKPEPVREPEVVPHNRPRPVALHLVLHPRGTLQPKFIAAVLENKIELLDQALQRGELDINAHDDNGNTLLHQAVFNFKYNELAGVKAETIQFLVKAGIDIGKRNNKGFTAYECATNQGRLDKKNAFILDILNPVVA